MTSSMAPMQTMPMVSGRRKRFPLVMLLWIAIAGLLFGLLVGAMSQWQKLLHPLARLPVSSTVATVSVPPQPPLPPLAQDSFRRPNAPGWGTASDGEAWQGDANRTSAFFIQEQQGHIAAAAGTFNAILGPSTTDSDIVALGTMNQFRADGATNLGVVVRWTDPMHWYKALLDGSHLSILKDAGGPPITLASLPFQARGGVSYALELRAAGETLSAIAWAPKDMLEPPAAWMLRVHDPALAQGRDGIRVVLHQTSCTFRYVRIDRIILGRTQP